MNGLNVSLKYKTMPNNPNSGIGTYEWLSYIESVIKEALDLTMDVHNDECKYFLHIINHEKYLRIIPNIKRNVVSIV